MSLTISQVTAFYTVVPTVTSGDPGFRPGYHISNSSRSGEGTVVSYTMSGWGEGSGCASFGLLVLSGSFLAGDSYTCSPGGSGTISTITSASHGGILCYGTMSDTDSTTNTNASLDDEEVDITVQDSSVFNPGDILRIDDTTDEYVIVEYILDATSIIVKRGLYGTAGTHTTGKDIYIVDTNLYEQILDADVSGSWGYSTSSNGKIELDCRLLLGSTGQTSQSILISSDEIVDTRGTSTNYILHLGNSTYRSYIQHGIGYLSDVADDWDSFAHSGSKVITPINGTTYTFQTGEKTNSYFFNSTIGGAHCFRGAIFSNRLELGYNPGGTQTFFTQESSKIYDTTINNANLLVGSANTAINKMKIYCGANYWVTAVTDATLRDVETDERFSDAGFICNSTKTLIDCKCDPYVEIFLGATTVFDNYKSFNCNVVGEDGEPIEGATVTCNWRGDSVSRANAFTENTDSDGNIEEQLVRFVYAVLEGTGFVMGIPNVSSYRDWEYFIRKSGYKTIRGRVTVGDRDDPIVLREVLIKDKFKETKSRGGI